MSTPNPKAYEFFLKWYVTPKLERQPLTLLEFCDKMNISEKEALEYQDRDSYYDDLYREARNWGRSKIPELLHALYAEFNLTKKPAILETYKKLLEVDKKEGGNTFNFNVLSPSDEQYRQILARETRHVESGSEAPSPELLSAN